MLYSCMNLQIRLEKIKHSNGLIEDYIFVIVIFRNGEKHLLGVDELDATLTFNSFEVLNNEYLMGSYFGGLKPKSYIHPS